jgi:hypothetical protein
MKNQFRSKDSEFENNTHIERKKKATSKVLNRQSKEKEVLEYGLEDEDELIDYERYLRK